MTVQVRHGSYGNYSGPYIKGTEFVMEMPVLERWHWRRVLWLTIMVESGGKLGSVMMADGTAATAGVEQSIIVYPRNLKVQGPLVGLIYLLDHVVPLSYYQLGQLLLAEGWTITGDKQLRYIGTGKIVPPRVIRETLTPNQGRVPRRGAQWEQSKKWALAFHELFSLPNTREAQVKHAIDGFTKFARRVEHKKLGRDTVENLVYGGDVMVSPFDVDTFEGAVNDLAMAMWWNYKTNAPAPALTRLGRAVKRYGADHQQFGRFLLRQLGTSTYGRWATNRWRRSRQHAMKVWPRELFIGPNAVMPKSFV
jgi:hypothetical protein